MTAWADYYVIDGDADDELGEAEERICLKRPSVAAYASRTGLEGISKQCERRGGDC